MSKDKKEDTALPPEVTDLYDVADVLGTGHFSKVKLATDRKTGDKVAIKARSRSIRDATSPPRSLLGCWPLPRRDHSHGRFSP